MFSIPLSAQAFVPSSLYPFVVIFICPFVYLSLCPSIPSSSSLYVSSSVCPYVHLSVSSSVLPCSIARMMSLRPCLPLSFRPYTHVLSYVYPPRNHVFLSLHLSVFSSVCLFVISSVRPFVRLPSFVCVSSSFCVGLSWSESRRLSRDGHSGDESRRQRVGCCSDI